MSYLRNTLLTLVVAASGLPAVLAQSAARLSVPSVAASIEMERVMRLLDGNTISQRSGGRYYRDAQARVRLEWGDQVTINDPVAKRSISIDPKAKTARVVNLAGLPEQRQPAPAAMRDGAGDSANGDAGSLGTQTIEGYITTGREFVHITPAGSPLGNVQPIKRVTRMWHSDQLALPLLTTIEDPFAGTTTTRYRSLVVGSDLPLSLFSVPNGFGVTETTVNTTAPGGPARPQ